MSHNFLNKCLEIDALYESYNTLALKLVGRE